MKPLLQRRRSMRIDWARVTLKSAINKILFDFLIAKGRQNYWLLEDNFSLAGIITAGFALCQGLG
jgi:hypothetical protein